MPTGPTWFIQLAADPLVESQLILHGLHPLTVDERIPKRRWTGCGPISARTPEVCPSSASTRTGVARLRLSGSCHGCASSTVTVSLTIEEAVRAAAPELTGIVVDGEVQSSPVLQIGRRPEASPAPAATHSVWRHPSAAELPHEGEVTSVQLRRKSRHGRTDRGHVLRLRRPLPGLRSLARQLDPARLGAYLRELRGADTTCGWPDGRSTDPVATSIHCRYSTTLPGSASPYRRRCDRRAGGTAALRHPDRRAVAARLRTAPFEGAASGRVVRDVREPLSWTSTRT